MFNGPGTLGTPITYGSFNSTDWLWANCILPLV
jgi:hypothetical protein